MSMPEQPAPTPNAGPDLWDEVIAEMVRRRHLGRVRYGVPVQAHNGRDALQDAFEEALDMSVYLHQHRREMKDLGDELRAFVVDLRTNPGMKVVADFLESIIKKYPVLG